MRTVPEPTFPEATAVLSRLVAPDGRITTHEQGLLLGRRIAELIDAGASVKVSLEGITEFHGPAVHSMLSEVFSLVGVDYANRKLVIVADRSAPYALGLPLHVSEAVAKFREQEQMMDPQPATTQVLGSDGEPAVTLTLLPKPLETKEPQTFGAPPVKNEVEEVLAKQEGTGTSGKSSKWLNDLQAAREKRLKDEMEEAARVKVEKSQEPITYEVEMDEKARVREWEEFLRWAHSGLGVKTPVEHEAAWKAWQLRAAIQQGEIEYWAANTKAAKRNTVLALVWAGIAWAFAAAVVFWRK
jgi:hypothetical protein